MLTSTDPEDCVTEYGYNDYSQIATLTVNGNTAAYEYDLAGNISAVTDAEGRRVNFAYDQNGNLTQITYPDGTTETTQYDLLGRVVLATPRTGLAAQTAAICPAMRQAWIAAVQPSKPRLPYAPGAFFLLEKFSDHVQKAVSCTLLLMTVVVKVPCIPSQPPKHDPLLTCCPRREDL